MYLASALSQKESYFLRSVYLVKNMGVWERISIGAYMIWVMVFAFNVMNITATQRYQR
jgi:hypothetical protein